MIDRRSAVRRLLANRSDEVVVAGLGSPVYDLFAAGDHPLNLYNWGAMGSAAMVGLGLALAQPDRRVLVLTGDGEMLMGLGALATIAQHRLSNLGIIVLDNEQYAETGMQMTATGFGVDLEAVARGCGFADATTLRSDAEVESLDGSRHAASFTVLKIGAGDMPRDTPERDGVVLTTRFRHALLGAHPAV